MAEDIDRLSELSDAIICNHILTKLSLKEAIASSLLSSRWRWLWTRLPRLKFTPEFCISLLNRAKVYTIMKKLVLINPGELESFELHISEHYTQEYQKRDYYQVGSYRQVDSTKVLVFFRKMSACISYAALRNVKRLTLTTSNSYVRLMPISVCSCQRLTSLILTNFDTKNCKPTCFGGFPCLKICFFISIDLCDATLEHLLAGSPHLESLTLSGCVGLTILTVCCPFLKDLIIEIGGKGNEIYRQNDQVYLPKTVKVNCPQLLSLKLERVSSWEDRSMLLEKTVVDIDLPSCRVLSTNLTCAKDILDSFPNLEDLSMDSQCFLENNEIRQVSASLEGKLRRVQVITSQFGETELSLLSYILHSCPLLETVTLSPPYHQTKSSLDLTFVHKLLGLQRSSAKARIFITQVK